MRIAHCVILAASILCIANAHAISSNGISPSEIRQFKATRPYFNRNVGRVKVEADKQYPYLESFRNALKDLLFASGAFDSEAEDRLRVTATFLEATQIGNTFPIAYVVKIKYELLNGDTLVGEWTITTRASSSSFMGITRADDALELAAQRNMRGFLLNLKANYDPEGADAARKALVELDGEVNGDTRNLSTLTGYLFMGTAEAVKATASAVGTVANTALKVAGSAAAGADNGNRDFSPTGPTSFTRMHNQAMANIQAMQAAQAPRNSASSTTIASTSAANRSRYETSTTRSPSADNEPGRRYATSNSQTDQKVADSTSRANSSAAVGSADSRTGNTTIANNAPSASTSNQKTNVGAKVAGVDLAALDRKPAPAPSKSAQPVTNTSTSANVAYGSANSATNGNSSEKIATPASAQNKPVEYETCVLEGTGICRGGAVTSVKGGTFYVRQPNNCGYRLYVEICIKTKSGRDDCGADSIKPGGSTSYWHSSDDATGQYTVKAVGVLKGGDDWTCMGKKRELETTD